MSRKSIFCGTAFLILAACASGARYTPRPSTYIAPCSASVDPVRNIEVKSAISITFGYTPKDESEGRQAMKRIILDKLNELGVPDGNSYREIEGEVPNMYFNFMFYNDGQDRFTGTLELSGWGQGHITTISKTQYPYATPSRLAYDLLESAYVYFHEGWHDPRPQCTGSSGAE